jgi:TonB family protein
MIGRVILCAAAVMSSTANAQAAPKQPTGRWAVKAIGNECLLTNSYGTASDPLFLSFSKAPMSSGFEMIILRKGKNADPAHGNALISLNGAQRIEAIYSAVLLAVNPSTGLKTRTLRRIWIGASDADLEAGANVSRIRVEARGETGGEFALPEFGRASEELEACAVGLGVRWGFSAEEQGRLAKRAHAVQPLQSYFSASDYPPEALRAGAMGSVRVKVIVNPAGLPSDCDVVGSSRNKDLDAATCDVIMKRARYEPAVDIDGRAVRAIDVTTVIWMLV